MADYTPGEWRVIDDQGFNSHANSPAPAIQQNSDGAAFPLCGVSYGELSKYRALYLAVIGHDRKVPGFARPLYRARFARGDWYR
jgi:hypothetical protein